MEAADARRGSMSDIDNRGQHNGSVNVEQAQADFTELSKQLSQASQRQSLKRGRSGHSGARNHAAGDVEQGLGKDDSEHSTKDYDDPLDLEALLRGARSEDEEAGIRSKRIGVLWDDLSVSGVGGGKICRCPWFFSSWYLDALHSCMRQQLLK